MNLNTSATNKIFPDCYVEDDKINDSSELQPPINIIGWLNRIMVEEVKSVLRYRQHHSLMLSLSKEASRIFRTNAKQKVKDVNTIALRITQLGGMPDMLLMNLYSRNQNSHLVKSCMTKLIKENLVAERLAVNSYLNILNYLSDRDPSTSLMLEEILLSDERRVGDLVTWLVSAQSKIRLVIS